MKKLSIPKAKQLGKRLFLAKIDAPDKNALMMDKHLTFMMVWSCGESSAIACKLVSVFINKVDEWFLAFCYVVYVSYGFHFSDKDASLSRL